MHWHWCVYVRDRKSRVMFCIINLVLSVLWVANGTQPKEPQWIETSDSCIPYIPLLVLMWYIWNPHEMWKVFKQIFVWGSDEDRAYSELWALVDKKQLHLYLSVSWGVHVRKLLRYLEDIKLQQQTMDISISKINLSVTKMWVFMYYEQNNLYHTRILFLLCLYMNME